MLSASWGGTLKHHTGTGNVLGVIPEDKRGRGQGDVWLCRVCAKQSRAVRRLRPCRSRNEVAFYETW